MKKKYNVTVNGEKFEVEVELADTEDTGSSASVRDTYSVPEVQPAAAAAPRTSDVSDSDLPLRAPMPGSVIKVNVNRGDSVKRGDSLVILEAMKMENEISAPEDGVISAINVSAGNSVASGDVLLYYHK